MKILTLAITMLAVALTTHAAVPSIETRFQVIEKGTTFSAPHVISNSGTPFEMTIGAPVDELSSAMPVGSTLRGVVTMDGKQVRYELTFIARDLDEKNKNEKFSLQAFTAKEYVVSGRAILDEEIRIKLINGKAIVLKFSEKTPETK